MPAKSLFLALCFLCTTAVADSAQQFANIGDLALESGDTIRKCSIGYRTAGKMNADKSNVIVFPSWFAGTTESLFPFYIGPGKLADTQKYFVVAIDALGDGVSSSPSNSPNQGDAAFPAITIDDMVTSQYKLLTEHLGISHVKVVMGISMGGMQTFQWMGQYPDFMDKAVAMDGSPKLSSYDLIQWQIHRDAIRMLLGADFSNEEVMKFLLSLNTLTLWTPQYLVENVRPEDVTEYLAGQEQGFVRMSAQDYDSQLEAMMDHDVFVLDGEEQSGYVERVSAEVLVVGVPTDQMVNPIAGKQLAQKLGASYAEINSVCGHMGTTCEAAQVKAIVHRFLD